MNFNETVIARGSGQFATFTVDNGVVKKNAYVILTPFGDKNVLIPTAARNQFTVAEEHKMLDGLLFALMSAGIATQYVDNVRTFLDPDIRFKEFLANAEAGVQMNTDFGLGLTDEELRISALMDSAKAKFKAIFVMPKTPAPDLYIDLDKVYGTYAADVAKWLTGDPNAVANTHVRSIGNNKNSNLLRIRKNQAGNPHRVETITGHSVNLTAAKSILAHAKKTWARGGEYERYSDRVYIATRERGSTYSGDRYAEIHPQSIVIGCQEIKRVEVERIMAQFDEIAAAKK